MPLAGDTVVSADTTTRVGATVITADSGTWSTAEVAISSVTFAAVSGRKYGIWFSGRVSADTAGDAANMRFREDSLSGNQLQLAQVYMPTTSGNGFSQYFYAEWTAPSSLSKTISLTAQRTSGGGVAHRIRATANSPAFLIVERVVE